jgi:hypothetical protein
MSCFIRWMLSVLRFHGAAIAKDGRAAAHLAQKCQKVGSPLKPFTSHDCCPIPPADPSHDPLVNQLKRLVWLSD